MAWTDYLNPANYGNPLHPLYLPAKAIKSDAATKTGKAVGGAVGQAASTQEGDNKDLLKAQLANRNPWTNSTGRQWTDLLQEQRATALGNRPTMAQLQYQQAMQDTRSSLAGAANGTNRPGVMRASMQQQANLGQGMAAGVAQANLQERTAAQQQYMAGLTGAGQVDARQNETWLRLMGILQGKAPDPSMWDRVASIAPYIGAILGKKGA